MSETRMTVEMGICGFTANVHAVGSDDYMSVKMTIESNCPNVKKLAEAINGTDVDSINAISAAIVNNDLIVKCSEFIPHPACPIPCALVKACEVAGGMALKKEVTIRFG
ncbi:MAG: hypothetical protein LBE47_01695 [Methanomassiliicoccaceae archaeon]|jgi:hypothetical protein|nr:hypothetical protein [Methanomassiliicoccaceae archaeon]